MQPPGDFDAQKNHGNHQSRVIQKLVVGQGQAAGGKRRDVGQGKEQDEVIFPVYEIVEHIVNFKF